MVLRHHRLALFTTTAVMVAGTLAVPGSAVAADTTTSLTDAEMATAITAMAKTTTTAAAGGWAGSLVRTYDGEPEATVAVVADPVGGLGYVKYDNAGPGTGYAVAGRGSYHLLTTARQKAAAKLVGKPSATFAFVSQPSLQITSWAAATPASPTRWFVYRPGGNPTRTVHDDGSVTYRFWDDTSGDVVLDTTAGGVLSSAKRNYEESGARYSWRYGSQHVSLPALNSTTTVGNAQLTKAAAYVYLRSDVKGLAGTIAKYVRQSSGKRTVKVNRVRQVAGRQVAAFNKKMQVTVVKVTNIKGGVRISAKSPYTGVKVAYTIKASGKKVIVKKQS